MKKKTKIGHFCFYFIFFQLSQNSCHLTIGPNNTFSYDLQYLQPKFFSLRRDAASMKFCERNVWTTTTTTVISVNALQCLLIQFLYRTSFEFPFVANCRGRFTLRGHSMGRRRVGHVWAIIPWMNYRAFTAVQHLNEKSILHVGTLKKTQSTLSALKLALIGVLLKSVVSGSLYLKSTFLLREMPLPPSPFICTDDTRMS